MTTWTTCLKITRTDATVIGITDLDVDLVIDGVTYVAGAGYTPSTFSSSSELSVDYADVEGLLDVAGVDRDDIRAGLYDKAAILLFSWDYVAGTQVKVIASGHWGECTLHDGRYVAEFRSLSQSLQQSILRTYTATCDAELGDARCGVNLVAMTEAGTVTGVVDRRNFYDASHTEADDFWRGGLVTFTSGNCSGWSMEVKGSTSATGAFELFLPMGADIQVGDTFTVSPGCDKSFATCKATYSNAVNFRGFPHVPGNDEAFKTIG